MKLELYQEGKIHKGDILVYCGDNQWCAKNPKDVTWKKTESIGVGKWEMWYPMKDQTSRILSYWGLAISLVALFLAIWAVLRSEERRHHR